jgi:molybdate transport system permease protein
MPLATYLALESDPEAALILSMLMITVSFVVLVGLRDRWLGHQRNDLVS